MICPLSSRQGAYQNLSRLFCIVGGGIATALGGWDAGLQALVICMAADDVSGLVVAGVFRKSSKTENGALESQTGFKGLCRKGMMLGIVLAAHYVDTVIGTNYVRDAVVIGFMANEAISIVENAGLMGVPLPGILKKAIDILTAKSEGKEV